MKSSLDALVKLAEDFRYYSKEVNGWNTQNYRKDGLMAWCYFAIEGDHTSVHFNRNNYYDSICISLHAVPAISFGSVANVNERFVLDVVVKYRAFLNDLMQPNPTTSRES